MSKEYLFYMNNPCKIIKEINENFVEVELYPLTEDVSQTGGDYCYGCMFGGTNSHQCDEYQEVIDNINDQRSDQSIITIVDKKYLQKEPVEFRAYKKLKEKYIELNLKVSKLRGDYWVLFGKNEIFRSDIEHLETLKHNLMEDINTKFHEFGELSVSIKTGEEYLDNVKAQVLLDGSYKVNISLSELKGFIEDSYTLNALNRGGVMNWDWYGESIGDYEDIQEQAREYLNGLKLEVV